MNALYRLAINPWVILGALTVGAALGLGAPQLALPLGFIGDAYVDLLKMVVLPFMVSAVMFSLQKLLRHGGAGAVLTRTAWVFALALAGVAAVGIASALLIGRISVPSADQVAEYGRIIGQDTAANDTAITLDGSSTAPQPGLADTLRTSLLPTNVFAALAQGEALKALVFALLFGLALGHVAGPSASGLAQALEAVYQSCQHLTRWLNYPLPLVLVCMSASQLARTGAGPLWAMIDFIAGFALASAAVVALAALVLWRRGGQSLSATLGHLRAPFALALATRSSATCMPAMIDALCDGLRLARERVELLVPLSVSLLRTGPVLYYVCATLFIAHLYGRDLGVSELLVVATAAILAGCASAGMTGLVTVSLTSMVCGYVGLPFEAAFVLFLAVDPVCDMLRTAVLVIGNAAAVAVVCEKPDANAATDADPTPAATPTAPPTASHTASHTASPITQPTNDASSEPSSSAPPARPALAATRARVEEPA